MNCIHQPIDWRRRSLTAVRFGLQGVGWVLTHAGLFLESTGVTLCVIAEMIRRRT